MNTKQDTTTTVSAQPENVCIEEGATLGALLAKHQPQAHSPLPKPREAVYKVRLRNGLALTETMELERQRDELHNLWDQSASEARRNKAHAQALADALRILNGCAERGLDQSATHDGLSNCKAIADAREAWPTGKGRSDRRVRLSDERVAQLEAMAKHAPTLRQGTPVICNGYKGVIVRHYDGKMYEIRLDRGVICTDQFEVIAEALTEDQRYVERVANETLKFYDQFGER